MKYCLSRLAALLHVDGNWVITNPARGSQVEVDELEGLVALLSLLAEPCTEEELLTAAGRGPAPAVKEDFVTLLQSGLAVPVEWEEEVLRRLGRLVDEPHLDFSRYFLARSHIPHADYSHPETMSADAESMRSYLRESPFPPLVAKRDAEGHLPLAHPATGKPQDGNSRLGHLLFWAFGKLRETRFFDLFPVLLKAVPSKGARHPFEVHLFAGERCIIDPGWYHYDTLSHALARLGDPPPGLDPVNPVLVVTAIYERVQWRYRHSWAYKDIFYDLGHVQCTLMLVAADLGLTISALDPGRVPGRYDYLVEDPVAAYSLEIV